MQNLTDGLQKPSKEPSLHFLYQNKRVLLEKALHLFTSYTSFIPKIGLELELYLTHEDGTCLKNSNLTDAFIIELMNASQNQNLVYQIEKEQGIGQIEIKTTYSSDLLKVCEEIDAIKIISEKLAVEKGLKVSFLGQPFIDDCGSALQFNLSLHDQNDHNLFITKETVLQNVIAALLHHTESILLLLAPNPQDYLRFDEEINEKLYKRGKYTAPINLSFGGDNRTCAIRVPEIKKDLKHYGKRIEYRVASASCDPFLAMTVIVLMSLQGIKDGVFPEDIGFQKVYGNAFDKQYKLRCFVKSYEEALKAFNVDLFS